MKHRDRIIAALNHQEPDRCPMQISFTPEFADRLRADLALTGKALNLSRAGHNPHGGGNTYELERALGSADKCVVGNEQQTVIVQRRCLRTAREIRAGETFDRSMIDVLRPATPGAIMPYEIQAVIGTRAAVDIPAGKELRWTDLVSGV